MFILGYRNWLILNAQMSSTFLDQGVDLLTLNGLYGAEGSSMKYATLQGEGSEKVWQFVTGRGG